ncbi:MAG: ChbG/HpnK family deacetylase [Planctomycetaceae bacterium]|nr:ChbG/HpnK family deacetylase [Planctomycetaceae bacterium]
MSVTRTLVVNVDDIGLHPAVRRAVERCAGLGTVTSASVLANGPDTDAMRPYAGVSLGAHLNILRGAPLSPAREVRSLVDARGLFVGSWAKLAQRVAIGAVDLDEVRLEWTRQVRSLLERGLSLSHLDGEKHTHCFPPLFTVACEVAEAHGIGFVRMSNERFGNRAFGSAALRRMTLRVLCGLSRKTPGVRTTPAVWGIAEQGAACTPEACMHALRGVTHGFVEIVCHPGLRKQGDPELPATFGRMRVHELWEPEFRSLTERPWRELAAAAGWRLAGFDGIE